MRMIVATNNPGKLAELRALLPAGVELLSLRDAELKSPPETGSTFLENALLKARAAAHAADAAIADDSGLEVAALDGLPGVRSARYAGADATDAQNNAKLLAEQQRRGVTHSPARFVSVVAFVSAGGVELTACGTVSGRIVPTPRGNGGFGYDPLFEIDDPKAGWLSGRTMAELSLADKNRISHRARALRSLLANLRDARVFDPELPAAVAGTESPTSHD